jgi:pilus assembly protein CpaB
MSSRRIIAVVAAVALAVLGTLAVFGYVRGADNRAVAGQEAVTVYIAQREVPAGTTLKDAVDNKLIVEQTVAAKGVPPTPQPTVSPTTEDLVATTAISPGEMVLTGRFAQETSSTSGLTIPDGMVAVSVALTDAAHVGPYVQNGSQIAIFDTFNVQTKVPGPPTPAGDHLQDDFTKTRATRLLLPKVQVIAVGSQVATPGQTSTQAPSGTTTDSNGQVRVLFTVAVTQSQAEVLIQGIQTGTLYFALLNSSSDVKPGLGVNDRDLFREK